MKEKKYAEEGIDQRKEKPAQATTSTAINQNGTKHLSARRRTTNLKLPIGQPHRHLYYHLSASGNPLSLNFLFFIFYFNFSSSCDRCRQEKLLSLAGVHTKTKPLPATTLRSAGNRNPQNTEPIKPLSPDCQ